MTETSKEQASLARIALQVTTVALAVIAIALAFSVPADVVQGEPQRFMYLHVPAAWSAYLSYAVVWGASVVFLRTTNAKAAAVARAAAQVGVALTGLTLATGMVWGALTWGTAWAWDARIISTVAMGLVYVVYLAARALANGRRSQTIAAWIGVVGIITVPIVHWSVEWWRTLHQSATVMTRAGAPPLDAAMGVALATSVLAISLLTIQVIAARAHKALQAASAVATSQAPRDVLPDALADSPGS